MAERKNRHIAKVVRALMRHHIQAVQVNNKGLAHEYDKKKYMYKIISRTSPIFTLSARRGEIKSKPS